MQKRKKLVIVGGGMAAGKLTEELLERGSGLYDITVIGEEKGGVYNRIKLVNRLQTDDLPDFWTHTDEWFRTNGVTGIFGQPVIAADHVIKQVRLSDNTVYPYDTLVLATGAVPFIPRLRGTDLPGVFALRNIGDVEKAVSCLHSRNKLLVIGGGLLGLELALGLKKLGKQITVSHLVESLMEFQLCGDAGLFLQKKLEAKGFTFIMNNAVTEIIEAEQSTLTAVFRDGKTLNFDAIFFNTGIKPNIKLAQDMGLRTNKGIVVDDSLETSAAGIFAAGECCEHRGKLYGLVAPVWDQARILAGVLCGEKKYYEGSAIPPTRLKSDIPVITMGRFNEKPGDEIAVYEDHNALIYKKLVIRDDKLIGANLVGEDLNSDAIAVQFTARLPLPPRRADLLFPGAGAAEIPADAKAWPDDVPICDCNGVSAGKIRKSIKDGNDTLLKVMSQTRAGTGCGNCKNKIKALLISEVGELKEDPAEKYYVPGIPMTREELSAFILQKGYTSVSSVFTAANGFTADAKSQNGVDYLLHYLYKGKYNIEYNSKAANDRYFANIQKDGRFSVIPRIHGGQAAPDQLRNIAAAAEKYNLTIKITGADRIGLYSIDKKNLKDVWKMINMDSGYAYAKTFRAAKSCVGSEFCRFGLGDSMALGEELCDRYHGTPGPAKFKMGVSGCPRNCAEATIKDFGVVAVEDGWDLFIGGSGGARVEPAKKITRVKTHTEVIRIADRFYEYYRRHAKYLERTALFVMRIGLEKITDAVLYDTPENLYSLENDFQAVLDSRDDPWKKEINHDNEPDKIIPFNSAGNSAELCEISDLQPGSARVFRTEAGDIALFHTRDGKWIAADAKCPHENGPIVDSVYGAGRLNCPIHGYSFDIITGKSSSSEVGNLKIYQVRKSDGHIIVDL